MSPTSSPAQILFKLITILQRPKIQKDRTYWQRHCQMLICLTSFQIRVCLQLLVSAQPKLTHRCQIQTAISGSIYTMLFIGWPNQRYANNAKEPFEFLCILHKRTINTAPIEAWHFLHTFNPVLLLVTLLSFDPLKRIFNIQVGTQLAFCWQNTKRKNEKRKILVQLGREGEKAECTCSINNFNSKVLGPFSSCTFPLMLIQKDARINIFSLTLKYLK